MSLSAPIPQFGTSPLPPRSIAEVKKWLQTHDKAIDPDEASFVDGHDDIIPVVAGDRLLATRGIMSSWPSTNEASSGSIALL